MNAPTNPIKVDRGIFGLKILNIVATIMKRIVNMVKFLFDTYPNISSNTLVLPTDMFEGKVLTTFIK